MDQLIATLSPVDLVLVEGYKGAQIPKIEVYRPDQVRGSYLEAGDANIMAVASDDLDRVPRLDDRSVVLLNLDDIAAIADFVLRHWDLSGDLDVAEHGSAKTASR